MKPIICEYAGQGCDFPAGECTGKCLKETIWNNGKCSMTLRGRPIKVVGNDKFTESIKRFDKRHPNLCSALLFAVLICAFLIGQIIDLPSEHEDAQATFDSVSDLGREAMAMQKNEVMIYAEVKKE